MDTRQTFEDWMKKRWCKPNLEMFRSGYVNKTVQEQWEAWQASRSSIVVELPKIRTLEYDTNDNPYNGGVYLASDDFYEVQGVEDALDKAGVKY